jgi:hypothetical protein
MDESKLLKQITALEKWADQVKSDELVEIVQPSQSTDPAATIHSCLSGETLAMCSKSRS